MEQFEAVNESLLVEAADKVEEAALAVKTCKCSLRWIDEACIWRSIEHWKPDRFIVCSGCFYLRPSQRDHECLGFIWDRCFPEPPEVAENILLKRTGEELREPDTVKALFAIYLESHTDAKDLERNFDLGIQHLLKTKTFPLKQLFLEKDYAAGYQEQ